MWCGRQVGEERQLGEGTLTKAVPQGESRSFSLDLNERASVLQDYSSGRIRLEEQAFGMARHSFSRMVRTYAKIGEEQRLATRMVAATVGLDGHKDSIDIL